MINAMPQAHGSDKQAALPPLLVRFWFAMAILTALSILYTATMAWACKLKFPYGIGMLYGDSLWGDLLVFRPGFQHFGKPLFWRSFDYPFTYPAPLAIPIGLLYRFAHPVRVYLLLESFAIAAFAWWFARQLTLRNIAPKTACFYVFTILAMTWPLLFLVDTANAEGFVVILLAGGVLAALRRRWWLGAALIGLAGAMKIFPLLLLGLFIAQRRYREFAFGLTLVVCVTVASLAYLGPSVVEAQRHINVGMGLIKHMYLFTLKPDAPALDHSLWVAIRYAAVSIDRMLHPAAPHTATVLRVALDMYLVAAALIGTALFVLKIRRLPTLNVVLALSICAVLLPPLSLEYTLVHLLLPFALFCAYAVEMTQSGARIQGLGACLACFAVLFDIETFLNTRYTYAAEFRTLALVALLGLTLRHRFAWPVLDRSPAA